ncbi:MAG: glycosyl transferase [Chitinophagaceae bacterium]|nr:glycosyl transferase [Chitinophagaceae bacterium]
MKILYAIQATGNGHIARATELMAFLQRYGTVDVFLSGSNSSIDVNLPVVYRSKGLSLFYGNRGGLNYLKMMREFAPLRIMREVNDLPVEKYDLVINDFEAISSMACRRRQIPFIHFGHQASFASPKSPRPASKDLVGEWLLKHYASSPNRLGLHFSDYDDFICSPVIKQQVLNAAPVDNGHVTVYLSHYADAVVAQALEQIPDIYFHIFSKRVTRPERQGNLLFLPVNNKSFTESVIKSTGVITGAGFETPAEALFLGKKLLCLPIRGQYEQLCNAAALEDFGVTSIAAIDTGFAARVKHWLEGPRPSILVLRQSTATIIGKVIDQGLYARIEKESGAGKLFPAF